MTRVWRAVALRGGYVPRGGSYVHTISDMGLLTILKKQRLKDKEIRVLLLWVDGTIMSTDMMLINVWRGLDNAGKTTIVKQILGQDVKEVSPTLGFSIQTVDYKG